MFSPIIISILVLLAYFFYKPILKYKLILYTLVWGLVAISLLEKAPTFLLPFFKGYVGFSFFYVVMIAGALPAHWKLTKVLKAIRAPYSVVGFIVLLVHPLHYANEVFSQTRDTPWFGLLALIVMIPLFVTSYMVIRKKMKPKSWKNLQKWAYLSYAALFVHLIIQASTTQNRIVAILLALTYLILKLTKEIKQSK